MNTKLDLATTKEAIVAGGDDEREIWNRLFDKKQRYVKQANMIRRWLSRWLAKLLGKITGFE